MRYLDQVKRNSRVDRVERNHDRIFRPEINGMWDTRTPTPPPARPLVEPTTGKGKRGYEEYSVLICVLLKASPRDLRES